MAANVDQWFWNASTTEPYIGSTPRFKVDAYKKFPLGPEAQYSASPELQVTIP